VRAHAPPATVRQPQRLPSAASAASTASASTSTSTLLVAVASKGTSLLSAMSAGEPSVYTQIYTLICCKRNCLVASPQIGGCCCKLSRPPLAINKVLYYAHSHLAAHPTTATSAPPSLSMCCNLQPCNVTWFLCSCSSNYRSLR